jgi:transcriptional regulator with XRE-family HTH domain
VDEDIRLAFGRKVRELRSRARWSQDKLAEESGLHRTYIGGVERGERNPTLVIIKKIADAFGVSLLELLSLDDDEHSQGEGGPR